ncbi:DNA polymerase III subunit delta' [Thermotomaculum hydrothermale]|uniref:DNA polymerase III subunit delta n=1 Tax=Thermotomaculum hydrothermale TaxID=981385 RepID=A0A7R6SYW6_9BACT|nr:hypothetical protein [Thermotomaculum hydrothermale]BBB33016.1 DNA polymerase III subunit delta' [Thermotomaculum hydrothermale]
MFDIVKGHEHIKRFFKNAYKNNKLHTTYLFKGREGIGKRLFAKVVAAMILCENKGNSPCGFCKHCLKIKNMIENPDTDNPHLDLIEIKPMEGKNEITVDDIETILTTTNFPPYEGKARIFIIDNCHLMNKTSANMVLKTLEEPPENTYFFLITSKPDALLPTIVSRCQQVYFNPKGLEKYIDIPGFSREEIKALINSGSGYIQSQDDIEELKREREIALFILESIFNKSSFIEIEKEIQPQIEKNTREDNSRLFFIIYTFLRDILAVKSESENLINRDFKEKIEEISAKTSPDFIFELFEIIKKTQTGLYFNLKPIQLISLIITEGRRVKL